MKTIVKCEKCGKEYGKLFPANIYIFCPNCGSSQLKLYTEDICYEDDYCTGWNENCLKVNSLLLGDHPIKFCPWCGERLYPDVVIKGRRQ